MADTFIPDILMQKKADIDALCREYCVSYLAVFGSEITEHFRDDSDMDLLVSFENGLTARQMATAFFGLKWDLKGLVDRPVDLVTRASLTNPYFRQSVMAGQRALYAA
jgi:predicted nucleotidyltransferase